MTCKIERPAPQALFDTIKNMFSVNVLGGSPVIQESNEWYVVANDYAMAEQFYAYADQLMREMDPATACCENLTNMAARNGVYPRPATFAEGYVKLTGTANADLPSRFEIATDLGNYVSIGSIPDKLSSAGSAVVRVRAITPGASQSGTPTSATLVSSIDGVQREVTICGGLFCGGAPAETCEQFRTRYLARLAYKPRATQDWIKEKLLEWPCATRVCERAGSCCQCSDCDGAERDCGCRDCGGKLQFYVMFDGVFECGIPPINVVDDLNVWMFGEKPGYGQGQVEIGVCGAIVRPEAVKVNVVVDIAGCPTASQLDNIRSAISDVFAELCPSQSIKTIAIQLAIANIIGTDIDTDVQIELVNAADRTKVSIFNCEFEPLCDYLLCLNDINLKSIASQGNC